MIKGSWTCIFWRFWLCNHGKAYEFIPLFLGICWQRDMELRNNVANELDSLRMYISKNINESEHITHVQKKIQELECKLYGRNIFG